MHVEKIFTVHQSIDVEPLLIAYFSNLSLQTIAKDALSKVCKNFFKEFKMNYRQYS
jgi:hypothetical protein